MPTLVVEAAARARQVRVTRDELVVELQDGRTVAVPLAWFPRLLHGTARQRQKWMLLGDGEGIRWPTLDEDLSVAGLLRGMPAQADFHDAALVRSRRREPRESLAAVKRRLRKGWKVRAR